MAVPRVIGIALKRTLRVEILHACEKAMNSEYRKHFITGQCIFFASSEAFV